MERASRGVAGLAGVLGTGLLLHGVADLCVSLSMVAVGSTASTSLLSGLVLVPRFAATAASAALKLWLALTIERLSDRALLVLVVAGCLGLFVGPLAGVWSGYATSMAVLQGGAGAALLGQLQMVLAALAWVDRLVLGAVLVLSFVRSRSRSGDR